MTLSMVYTSRLDVPPNYSSRIHILIVTVLACSQWHCTVHEDICLLLSLSFILQYNTFFTCFYFLTVLPPCLASLPPYTTFFAGLISPLSVTMFPLWLPFPSPIYCLLCRIFPLFPHLPFHRFTALLTFYFTIYYLLCR